MRLSSLFLPLVAALAAPLGANAARALDTPVAWNARFAGLRGNTSCAYGDPDCNRCVNDVSRQFRAMAVDGNFVELVNGWTWKDKRYEPGDMNPDDTLSLLPGSTTILGHEIGPGGGSHFQSMVRSQSASPNMVVSYGGNHAAVFMVEGEQRDTGELGGGVLEMVYPGATTHPGGMAAVGEHVLVASDDDAEPVLQFLNLSSAPGPGVLVPMPTHMANVSAAQLASGGYLMLTTTTSKLNEYRLWYTSSLDRPDVESVWAAPLETTGYVPDVDGFHGFENTSLITECGTGDIYMLGVNGKPDVGASNRGIWALYRLTASMALEHVAHNTQPMHGPACNTRASGTAFAGPNGELVLTCHQKGQRAAQRIDGIACAMESALPLDPVLVPLFEEAVEDEEDNKLRRRRRWGKRLGKFFKAAAVAVAAATVPGLPETVAAVAGTAAATATAAAGTAAATGAAVAGTAVAGATVVIGVGGVLVTNFGISTLVIPNGACMRAITPGDRIMYTEFWPTDD